MRITGGKARGIELAVPKGDGVRPATDAMRQAVFSSLGERVVGARFLDLYAGSGAYGLEALSRGAQGGAFVERDRRAAACLWRNVGAVCKSMGRGVEDLTLVESDVASAPEGLVQEADLVFVDPPYEEIGRISEPLFARLSANLSPAAAPVVVFEMPGEVELQPAGWTCVKRLGKGARQPTAAFFRRN